MSEVVQSGPQCPYCGAGWTEDMLAALDAATGPSSCACCADVPSGQHIPAPDEPAVAIPTDDIRCASCNKPIFLAPKPHSHHQHG